MKLKRDGEGHVIVNDNDMPIYVDDDGKDHAYDAPALRKKLDSVNESVTDLRKSNEELSATAKSFEGLDADAARRALDMVSKLDQKKLIDAGEVDRVRKEVADSYQAKVDEAVKQAESLQSNLHEAMVGNAFASSKFIADRAAVPGDVIRSMFGGRFAVEDGRIVASNEHGEVIRDPDNAGEPAGFDVALQQMVDNYPHKDSIIKSEAKGGMGSNGHPSGASTGDFGGDKSSRRAAIESIMQR